MPNVIRAILLFFSLTCLAQVAENRFSVALAPGEDTVVGWSTKPYGYMRVRNTQKGLAIYDVFGTKRYVPFDKVRTSHLPVALGESPLYIVAEQGMKATPRPEPGW
jgi:hypothetical protein